MVKTGHDIVVFRPARPQNFHLTVSAGKVLYQFINF